MSDASIYLSLLRQVTKKQNIPAPDDSTILQLGQYPTDTATGSDTVTTTVTDVSGFVWSGIVAFGTASDWQSCALSSASATQWQGSVVLAKSAGTYSLSGTATTPTIDLTNAAKAQGATVTLDTDEVLVDGTVSASKQIRFSSDGVTWGAWQAVTANMTPLRYCQVYVQLSSTNGVNTPQVSRLRLLVRAPQNWGTGTWR